MALQPKQRVGPYEILCAIGAGGMGEVYQARDTKLGRDIAIKVLPEAFAHDADRLARFQREAKTLASLNHPNIATIHGLEQSNGTSYLVMEMVRGETLAERIGREGAVPVEEALKIAVQIAEALEAAHEKGVIHRDLKPANVKVTPEGKVKVLDFGLAKAFAGDVADSNRSQSPTLSAVATMQGVLLGTAAYMSPEQARGKAVDRRTDIWAFGCVLYEMLTGKQAFDGEDITEILAAVVKTEPDCQALPPSTPAQIRTLLKRCLQKDKTRRMRDAGDAYIEIEEAQSAPVPADPRSAVASKLGGWRLPALVSLVVLVVAALAGSVGWNLKPVPAPSARSVVTRFIVALRPSEQVAPAGGGLAISPDGTYLAYTSAPSAGGTRTAFAVSMEESRYTRQIFLRPMNRSEAVPIPGTDNATGLFFSPDGQWIAFTADGKLKKVPLGGGTPILLCERLGGGTGSWGPDGTILFPEPAGKLMRVAAAGGTPEVVPTTEVKPGENGPGFPEVLPGGQAILYAIGGGVYYDDAAIVAQSLRTAERKTLIQGGTSPHYLSTGHIVYAQGGRLLVVPFDLRRLEVTGTAAPILEDVWQGPGGYAAYSVARNGSLAYINGGESAGVTRSTLNWVDRTGAARRLSENHLFFSPSLSPDGQRVAITNGDLAPIFDVWISDLNRGTLARLTFGKPGELAASAVWTPDGKRVIYSVANRKLMWRPADGSGTEEQLFSGSDLIFPLSCSPDGQLLVFYQIHGEHRDLWALTLAGNHEARPLIESPFDKVEAQISPDGRWLAYASNESGHQEVYAQPFPDLGGKWQISTAGGAEPRWSRDGHQLFYLSGDKMMVVEIQTKAGFSAGSPRLLFDQPYAHNTLLGRAATYDVAPDGQHFLMLRADDTQSSQLQLRVVLNWTAELKSHVPTGK
jgi:eukaryotic-like serine/threonine-protein kinase